MSSITQHTTRRLSHCYWRFELRAHRALCLESRVLSGARDDVGSLDSLAGGCAGVGFDCRHLPCVTGRLSHTVYRKPTHTDRYLRADSHHHPSHLASVPRTLINRALNLCDPQYIDAELDHLKQVSVLAREKYFVPRKVREAIEISRRPNFNRDGGWALPPAWKPSLQSASAYNVAGLECDTVSAVCDTVFASTRESNPTPAQPPASESNEPTSSRAPDSTRDSRQRARWARGSNRQ
ncbi:hypothetical protein SFRURICE_000945 [Spodoptera frugiperda]|nr:hypothetical protein SFRURICE_000945 [Spodoptera frugiperda]